MFPLGGLHQSLALPWQCGRNEALRTRHEGFVSTLMRIPQPCVVHPGDAWKPVAVALPDAVAACVPLWPGEQALAVLRSRTLAPRLTSLRLSRAVVGLHAGDANP
jgi:hypothetical protein